FICKKHKDVRPVFALVKDLLHFVLRAVELDSRLAKLRALSRSHVVMKDGWGGVVARESVERLGVLASSAETAGSTYSRQLDFTNRLSLHVHDPYLCIGVL